MAGDDLGVGVHPKAGFQGVPGVGIEFLSVDDQDTRVSQAAFLSALCSFLSPAAIG